MSTERSSEDGLSASYEDEEEMAQALLNVEEDDVVELSFKWVTDDKGEIESTTKQRVEDIADGVPTKIYMEECPGWKGPSITLIVFPDPPHLKPVLKHPTKDPTPVREFTELEVNPDD